MKSPVEIANFAKTDPQGFLAWVKAHQDDDIVFLTWAAEALELIPGDEAKELLLVLADHAHPIVREGAVYGMARHGCPKILEKLRLMSTQDGSGLIRHIATDILYELEHGWE